MQRVEKKKCILSIVAVLLFVISMMYSVNITILPKSSSFQPTQSPIIMNWAQEPPPPPPPGEIGENGTFVGWRTDRNSTSDEWTWENRNWLFGPKPKYEIFHENGSLLTKDSYAEIGEWLTIKATIPKGIFSKNTTLGSVGFSGWYYSADVNFSASFNLRFDRESPEPWSVDSFIYNASETDPQTPPSPPFLDLNVTACSNYSDASSFYVVFVVRFNSETPLGLYGLDMEVLDNEYNYISTYGFDMGWEFRGISVGVPMTDAWAFSYGGTFTLQKLDLDDNVLYSVSRMADFKMRFNITGSEPKIVRLEFLLPDGIETLVNVTGWYTTWEITTGGWEYNPDAGTYIWNNSAEVRTLVEKYGPHPERRWVDLNTWKEVNVTFLYEYWNETSQQYVRELKNETQWVQSKVFLTYNVTANTWTQEFGYTVWGYPYDHYVENTWNEEMTITEPYPPDLPVLYELNVSRCQAQKIGADLVVDFVGHFTKEMPKSTSWTYFSFNPVVKGSNDEWYDPAIWGEHPRQSQSDFENAKQIAIETPVTIAKILNEDGTEPFGWMFNVEKGMNFMVQGQIQGGSSIADDIDAVRFSLQAYDGYWSEFESWFSQLTYEITSDMSGVLTLRAFNFTQKQNYTYGTYWDWVLVNKTGWHYEYNYVTNEWDWVFGNYTDWEWKEIEGWYWAWWYYNQKTGEWQEKWIDPVGPETAIASDFATVTGFQKWTEGGDLFVKFLVNMSQNVPDTSYWWDFAFMNNTWHEDPASDWGMHLVYSWQQEQVYSFSYNGNKLYVKPVNYNQLGYDFLNGTLAGNRTIAQEQPYIIIANEKLPIKVYETYDPWVQTSHKEMFFYDHWDPTTEKDVYYYELTNGTKIYVTYVDAIRIYNVTISPGNSFLTAQEYEEFWEYDGTFYYYWVDIYGNIHQGDESYAKSNVLNFTVYTTVELSDFTSYRFVRYGLNNLLNITEWWWSSIDNTYYMMDTDGNLYQLIYDSVTSRYMAYISGAWEYVSWPIDYYKATYNGQEVMLVTWNIQQFYYYEKNGVRYELPYPGANAFDQWEMNNFESEGGKVPTTKSLIYDGVAYPVTYYPGEYGQGYVKIQGIVYNVTEIFGSYTEANGTPIWDPVPIYQQGKAGYFDEYLQFTAVDTLNYTSYYYDSFANCYYMQLTNGTMLQLNETIVTVLYEYLYDGKPFYSFYEWPEYRMINNQSWYVYEAINGTLYLFEYYTELIPSSRYVVDLSYDSNSGKYYFTFNSKLYNTSTIEGMMFWSSKILNGPSQGLYFDLQSRTDVYQFEYNGTFVNATAATEYIYRLRYHWGHELIYGPVPLETTVYKNFDSIIIGIPDWGMWGIKNWAITPENGALDLDGDFDTTDDQYFILEIYESKDSWNHTWEHMDVWLMWDPNGTLYGDEMHLNSWMGVDTFTWSYQWNDTFYWYHADDFSPVNATEMDQIRATVLTDTGEPRPGYWDIAWMTQNVTWEDILAKAQAEGWDWITSNEQTWTWLSFGIEQDYGTSYLENDVDHWLSVNLHYEFSGLMIWEDKNDNNIMDVDLNDPGSGELTHFLVPESVDSVSFVTPGMAYGNTNESDFMKLNLTDEVTWGVTFYEVNGTVYPFTTFGYWGWYDGVVTGTDLRTFDERPTKVSIDELSFLVHFQGNITESGLNNNARVKVDNYIGNWDVDMLGGRANLENRSLALNYFSEVQMSDFAFKANGTFADSESTVSADTFELETEGAKFAEMIMGGVTYDWSKNTSAPFNVVSHTTPVGTFRTAFLSESGVSATAWSFSSTMYIVTIGFPYWDGYSVFQDPVFVSYVSSQGASSVPGAVTFGAFSIYPEVPTANDTVTVSVEIYASEPLNSVTLMYSTDAANWESTGMWQNGPTTYQGEIPPYPNDTTVYFKVGVETPSGYYESAIQSYVVGKGLVTTTVPTGGLPGFGIETMVLVVGVSAVILVVVVLLLRRRK